MSLFPLLLDLLVIPLLLVTIWWAARLNRALTRMRDSRADMEAAILRFSDAAARAESAIRELKSASAAHGEGLSIESAKAKAILAELKDLNEIAHGTAERLERQVAAKPAATAAAATTPAPAPSSLRPAATTTPTARSRAERELLAALMGDER